MQEPEVKLCEELFVHNDKTERARRLLPQDDLLIDLAELYKVFGDSTRIKILYVLFEQEMCVCDIAELLKMTVSAISHQLRILKGAGLIKYRKDGKSVFYSLADDHVHSILAQGMEHITE